MRYHLVTIGCQMNKSDSERVHTVIRGMGYAWTDDEADADLVGVLACSVRQKAIDRVYTRIHRWNQLKDSRNLLTFVTGCVLPADRVKFLKLFDFVFTMNELPDFPQMVQQYGVTTPMAGGPPRPAPPVAEGIVTVDSLTRGNGKASRRPVMDGLWQIEATPESSFQAYVPIQNGCDKFCTFCAVPYTRGREVSRSSADILAEVDSLVSRGYKSITLLGQNVNSYGQDKSDEEMGFAELLQHVGELGLRHEQRFWVYFTSPHPRDMTDDVIEMIAQYPCLGRQVHLPLQSGDDRVLRRMNRKHTLDRYRRIVNVVRDRVPEATLFTDIIVGFTGETDAEFEQTRRAMDAFSFDMAYIAMYSPRPGAASSRWADDVPHEVKRARFHVLDDLMQGRAEEMHAKLVSRVVPVLVTQHSAKHKALIGLTEGKTSVMIETDSPEFVGEFVDVEITSVNGLALAGERVVSREPVHV